MSNALPTETTRRFFIDYTNANQNHTLLVRATSVATISDVETEVGGLFNALAPRLLRTTILGVREAAAGSPFSFPVPSFLDGNVYGTGADAPVERAAFISFVGRSATGRRCRVYIFGPDFNPDDNWRYTRAELPEVGLARDIIENSANLFRAIDGAKVFWQDYANFGYHAYWQKEQRG